MCTYLNKYCLKNYIAYKFLHVSTAVITYLVVSRCLGEVKEISAALSPELHQGCQSGEVSKEREKAVGQEMRI